jgi:hypothetical protein
VVVGALSLADIGDEPVAAEGAQVLGAVVAVPTLPVVVAAARAIAVGARAVVVVGAATPAPRAIAMPCADWHLDGVMRLSRQCTVLAYLRRNVELSGAADRS